MEQAQVSEARESDPSSSPADPDSARQLYWILYPKELEDEIVEALEGAGVPGYTEFPKLVGRGRRVRHFDNPIWPGATGAIITVISPDQAASLVEPFQRLNRMLEERSHG